MRLPLLSPIVVTLIAVPISAQTPQHPAAKPSPVFIASLRGTTEVPPVKSEAYGMAKLTLVGPEIRYQVTVGDLRDVTGVFLHIGGPGETKPIVATLFEGAKAGPVNGTLVSGTLRPKDVHGVSMSKLLRAVRTNDAYLIVETKAHPRGELRGELTPQPESSQG